MILATAAVSMLARVPGVVGLSVLLPVIGSVYSTLRLSPLTALSVPLLLPAWVLAVLETSVPRNIPLLTPVSVSVTVSISLVVVLLTFTLSVSSAPEEKFWSPSVTCR